MPDKKLTDAEIIKALECRVKDKCPECPYFHGYPCDKCRNMQTDALDLINRQKAEIERLRKAIEKTDYAYFKKSCELDNLTYDFELLKQEKSVVKAEAYKEFADKVHNEIEQALESNYKVKSQREQKTQNFGEDVVLHYAIGKIDCLRGLDGFTDNLLKELVGDTDES